MGRCTLRNLPIHNGLFSSVSRVDFSYPKCSNFHGKAWIVQLYSTKGWGICSNESTKAHLYWSESNSVSNGYIDFPVVRLN